MVWGILTLRCLLQLNIWVWGFGDKHLKIFGINTVFKAMGKITKEMSIQRKRGGLRTKSSSTSRAARVRESNAEEEVKAWGAKQFASQ